MLIFNSLIASSETFQLSPNLRVIGYSNFYCCTGHNPFFCVLLCYAKIALVHMSKFRWRDGVGLLVWYFF